MARFYWLVNLNRSRVKRFTKMQILKINFFKYIFIASEEVASTWEKNHLSRQLDKN